MYKHNVCSQLHVLLCSLNLLFGGVLDAIVVMPFLSTLFVSLEMPVPLSMAFAHEIKVTLQTYML